MARPANKLALVVETLSPADRWGQVMQRINRFLLAGVPQVWLVDPEGRAVIVYRLGQYPQVIEADGELTGLDVLPSRRFRAADFFLAAGQEGKPGEE